MTVNPSRRVFLGGLAAGGALGAWPVLARTSWSIRGSERGALRLVFYTDIHARTEPDIRTALAMAADAINVRSPDIVLCGGDLIAGGFRSTAEAVAPRWDAYMTMAGAIAGEHHAVIGNHDLVAARPRDGSAAAPDPRLAFRQRLGLERTYGAVEALGYHFLLLDSLRITGDEYEYHGVVSPEQIEWMRSQLSRIPRDAPVVLVSHMPLLTGFFSASKGGTFQAPPDKVVVNNAEVLALFAERNLVMVLQGHLHVTELLQWRGTTFLTGGAISGGWWRGRHFGTGEGFCAITLRPDRIDWDYIGYGWAARLP